MKSKASPQNRLLRIISIPIRALCKARDIYIKSMSEYGDRVNYFSLIAVPVNSGLPRSFSARSCNDKAFQELARASSNVEQQTKMKAGSSDGPRAMPPRSSSVAMGRIDEDKPCCYFGEDESFISSKNEIRYPRSRSHGFSARRISAF